MTSRPAPGVQDTLQHRGGAPAYAPVRRATTQHGQDPAVDHERIADDRPKAKPKGKPIQLDGLQTTVGAPPRGKPQLFFGTAVDTSLEPSEASPAPTHLPVPPRPSLSMPGEAQQPRLFPGGTGVKGDPSIAKTGVQASPVSAVIFPGGKTADLFPWSGNHPEDMLTELVIKGGFPNKPQIMNETNTARPSLWANLKNKSGASTLSTLFLAVLEKRQSCSRLTAPNTFKPPPRLTLRDSTRETWLHDLANPAVGLRRLSRTIPHGITGKVLLDQCLNKSIPIPRAMWLAKCVGINEMRAHKRKGQAGTITWVRDWTSSVEQFLEGTVAAIGQQDWKARVTYALQLSTHLFKEHLLEEEHFVDWVLKSLDSSSPERLFLWLLITCIPDFWNSLTSSRRRAKALAESLLGHAEKLYDVEEEIRDTPVLGFLESIITKVVITKPSSLLLPNTWEKHGSVLQVFAQRHAHIAIPRCIAQLDQRNKGFLRPSSVELASSQRSLGALFRLLDSVDYSATSFVDSLAFDCMELVPDPNRLVSAVLQWASSLYRQGLQRLYLATRLLRRWNQVGTDVCEGIMAYLPHMASDSSKEPGMVFRVVAELVRSKTFSLGRYLQWLIATGSLNQHRNLNIASAWPLRLLTEIPLTGLSEQVYNLRSTLLRGTLYSVETEAQLMTSTEDAICQQLPNLFGTVSTADPQATFNIEHLSQTVRLETAIWLRRRVAATVEVDDRVPTKDNATTSVCMISRTDFDTVRTFLEKFNDLSILADVVGIVATSYDSQVLIASADTLRHHYEAFKVIGAFDPLFEKLVMRYTAIRTIRFPERDLLLGLIALSRLTDVDPQLVQLLDYDLGRYDQKNSIAACSPVSDTMIDNMTPADPEEEIERILSSGTSMDQLTMNRVFTKIVSHFEERLCKGSHSSENLSGWSYRLRNFECSTFDMILTSWLGTLVTSHQQHLLAAVLPPLVVSGSLTISRFLKLAQECMRRRQPSHPAESFCIAVEALDRILPGEELCGMAEHEYAYRFRTEQVIFCRKQDSGLLGFFKEIFELGSNIPETRCQEQFARMLSDNRLLNVLRHFVIVDVQTLSFLLDTSKPASDGSSNVHIESLFDRLLDPLGSLDMSQMSCEQQATTIFRYADQLSLPFCQLKLQHLFITSSTTAEDSAESISGALMNFLQTPLEHDHPYWLDLVSGLDTGLTNEIQEHAEREILKCSVFLCDPIPDDSDGRYLDEPSCIRRYLDVILVASIENTREVPVSVLVLLIERLKGIAEMMNQMDSRPTGFDQAARAERSSLTSTLCSWLHILLRLVVFQSPGLILKASHQHQAALMWSLRGLFTHPHLEVFPTTTQYVFDVAMFVSDYISEDVRKHLMQLDFTKCGADSRCAFIFGASPQPDGWLRLIKATNTPITTPNATPSSQQQPSGGPAPLQRSSSHQQYQQQMQPQAQGRAFPYPQQQQPHKGLPQQLQRAGSQTGPGSQLQQMQQMQQMQAIAQQRHVPHPPQRSASMSSQSSTQGKSGNRPDAKPVPFALNRWEILPDSGGNPAGNETAISLNLFGARRV